MATEFRFRVGDRVSRPVDVFGDHTKRRNGRVTRAYSTHSRRFGFYPEVYDVRWDGHDEDDGGYLRHGLDPEPEQGT